MTGEALWIQEWILLKWMACWKQSMSFSGSGLEKQVERFKQQRVSLLWANIIKTTCSHSPKLLGPFYLRQSPLPELHWTVSSFLDTFPFSKNLKSDSLNMLGCKHHHRNQYKVKSFHSKKTVKTSFKTTPHNFGLTGIHQAPFPCPAAPTWQ